MAVRILLADPQQMFREVLRRLLALQPDITVLADTSDGQKLVELTAEHKPDIILLDIKLDNLPAGEALEQIAALRTGARPILLTERLGRSEIVQALLWGVRGMIRKQDPSRLLFKSIRAVMDGQYWISREGVAEVVRNMQMLAAAVQQNARTQARSLPRQQQQILEAIVAGCSNKQIAQDLDISERTVKYHLTRIFEKFGVTGRMELARYSLEHKVVPEL